MNDINLSHQMGLAAFAVFLIDWLKKSSWFPWMNQHTETLNRIVSWSIALAGTIGLSVVSHTGDWQSGGQITIAFPSLISGLSGLFHVFTQIGCQELGHKTLGNHKMLKDILGKVQ